MPNLADHNKCVGCTACMNVCPMHCIEITKDIYGFGYSKIINSSSCVECASCEKVCPVLSKRTMGNRRTTKAYAAISCDESVRIDSSSGGVFTQLAKSIIAQDGVVYGAEYDEQFVVRHCCVDNAADLKKLRGAKYSESDLGYTFIDIFNKLNQGKKVLFSGTPCQVAGLKSFLSKDYDTLFCVDFVCHGVPSPMAWKSYVQYRAEIDDKGHLPVIINLRSKETGWSHYQYSNHFLYKDGNSYSELSTHSLYMKLFVDNCISRLSCETCQFKGYERISDVTLGDFWGIWDIDPDMDDNKGTSVVLVSTDKGNCLWETINDNLKWKEMSLEQASLFNPSMLFSSKANSNRNWVLSKIKEGKIEDCRRIYSNSKETFLARMRERILKTIKSKHK